jgi:hypothetical protein
MERKAGDERDIAVHEAIGPKVLLMADPNYGYRRQIDAAWRLAAREHMRDIHI